MMILEKWQEITQSSENGSVKVINGRKSQNVSNLNLKKKLLKISARKFPEIKNHFNFY